MQWIKTVLLAMALCLSFNAAAMTDDDEAIWREALIQGQLKTVQQYVNADAKVVNEKIFGWSPLQMATNAHQIKVVEYLVSKGADLNYLQPFANHTAFHLAAFNQDKELLQLLAKSGADVNIKLRNDLSLIQFFRDEGDEKMITFLKTLGVKDDGCKGEYC